MEIIDNFLEKQQHLKLVEELTKKDLSWFFADSVVYGKDSKLTESLYNYQFVHVFYIENNVVSPNFKTIVPLLQSLNADVLVRIKANLRPVAHVIEESEMHTDIIYPTILKKTNVMSAMKTAIYYVNSNNGYTIFEDGTKVESVENRIVIFPTSLKHTGTTCTDAKYRLVINFNYF